MLQQPGECQMLDTARVVDIIVREGREGASPIQQGEKPRNIW